MLTINDKNIILGSIGGGGGSAPVLPDDWDSGWMLPPTYDATTVNGKTDICGIVCNVLDIGDRNYFSCIATGAYTVNVYTDATATTLISTQNVASNVQANWQIDYAACTYQLNSQTRQAWVEIVPQSGQALTLIRFNTNHPSETNANSSPNIVGVVGVLPALTDATNMFNACGSLQNVTLLSLPALTITINMFLSCGSLQKAALPNLPNLTNATNMFNACYALQNVTLPNLPNLTNATSMFQACYALQNVTLPNLPNLTNAANMFGTDTEITALRSLRKLIFPSLIGIKLRYGAMQAQELNALFTSLGTANGVQTIDVRNNPGSTTCNTSIATAKGYTVLTA